MSEGWLLPWPDLTSEAIIRIDAELARTQAFRDRLAADCVCVICGEPGVPHVHWHSPADLVRRC